MEGVITLFVTAIGNFVAGKGIVPVSPEVWSEVLVSEMVVDLERLFSESSTASDALAFVVFVFVVFAFVAFVVFAFVVFAVFAFVVSTDSGG